ncbi:MAG: hypothetical protein QOH26_947 [Actinomycetota bacterium]|nr:hypothetical protein [Actinomycetota bacterium]
MPRLRPFRGIRYSPTQRLADVTCPPYDVISPEEQTRLHERDPNNAVRLELAQTGDDEDGKYKNASETFRRWLDDGVLQQDEEPSFYVYRQDFTGDDGARRRVVGVIGALELEPFGSGVLPHERTMPGPKKDRLALMRALPVNISPIYAIYRGGGGVASFYGSLADRPPVGRFQDEQGILHRLWKVTAPAEIELLAEALAPGPLVIADGHHRYETALAFAEESGDELPEAGTVMCLAVDADAEELVVLPYNRALRSPEGPEPIVDALASLGARPIDPAAAKTELEKSTADHPFVFVTKDGEWLVEVSDEYVTRAVGERAPAWRDLDVVALHEVLLPEVAPNAQEIVFSKDPEEVRRLVQEEGWTAGVLLRALHPAEVVEVARSGERMPQKASYFWPKAITGLVFHPLS